MKYVPPPPKKFGKMSIGFICAATLSVVKNDAGKGVPHSL